MLMPHLRTCLAAMLAALAPVAVKAAPLPVQIDRFDGEVVQVNGNVHSGVLAGRSLPPGSQVQTGSDGRAELSVSGAPTVALGAGTDLLVHSVEQGVVRLRIASGAMRIDARAAGSHGARDVRVNAGDLRLRINGADAWIEIGDRGGQVCLISGVVEAQQPSSTVRLDTPGQCLRQSGLTSQWSMVPMSVLEERIVLVGVRAAAAVAAAPRPEPKPRPEIKALPLPIEPEPAPKVANVEPQATVVAEPADLAKVPLPVEPPKRAPDTVAVAKASVVEPIPVPPVAPADKTPVPAAPVLAPPVPAPAIVPNAAGPAAPTRPSSAVHLPPVIVKGNPAVPGVENPANRSALAEKSAVATAPVMPVAPAPRTPDASATPTLEVLYPHTPPVIVLAPAAPPEARAPAGPVAAQPSKAEAPAAEVALAQMPASAGTAAMTFPAALEAPAIPVPPAPKSTAATASKPAPTAIPAAAPSAPPVVAVAPAPTTPAAVVAASKDTANLSKSIAPSDAQVAVAAPASAPGADDGKRWRVVLGSMPEPEMAETEAERLNARGWAVEAREYRVGDRSGYRIGFGEFAAREEAQKALEEFMGQYPDATAWLAKY